MMKFHTRFQVSEKDDRMRILIILKVIRFLTLIRLRRNT